jgi:hypothetical protein
MIITIGSRSFKIKMICVCDKLCLISVLLRNRSVKKNLSQTRHGSLLGQFWKVALEKPIYQ